MIKYILRQRCKHEPEYILSTMSRYGYTIKALIIELIGKFRELKAPDYIYNDDLILVAVIDSGTSYAPGEPIVHWFYALSVGRGIFHNWFTVVWSDSD